MISTMVQPTIWKTFEQIGKSVYFSNETNFNAKIGREEASTPNIGVPSLHEQFSDNGQ